MPPEHRGVRTRAWVGVTHLNPIYIIYHKPGELTQLRKSGKETPGKLALCMHWALIRIPIGSEKRIETDRHALRTDRGKSDGRVGKDPRKRPDYPLPE